MVDSEPTPAEDRLFSEYPALSGFFETVLWPGSDGSNVIELIHRVMRNWHSDYVTQFVKELQQICTDLVFSDVDLTGFFNQCVPADDRVVDVDNCRAFLRMLAGFARYLCEEDGVGGTGG
jgi:hypothetical protein